MVEPGVTLSIAITPAGLFLPKNSACGPFSTCMDCRSKNADLRRRALGDLNAIEVQGHRLLGVEILRELTHAANGKSRAGGAAAHALQADAGHQVADLCQRDTRDLLKRLRIHFRNSDRNIHEALSAFAGGNDHFLDGIAAVDHCAGRSGHIIAAVRGNRRDSVQRGCQRYDATERHTSADC